MPTPTAACAWPSYALCVPELAQESVPATVTCTISVDARSVHLRRVALQKGRHGLPVVNVARH